jgi:hypothetical protein
MYFNCRIQSSYTRPFKLAQIHHTNLQVVVYIMHHKVVPCQIALFPGHTYMVRSLNNAFLNPLGRSPTLNQTMMKRSDNASKSGYTDVFNVRPQRIVLGFFENNVWLYPFFSLD